MTSGVQWFAARSARPVARALERLTAARRRPARRHRGALANRTRRERRSGRRRLSPVWKEHGCVVLDGGIASGLLHHLFARGAGCDFGVDENRLSRGRFWASVKFLCAGTTTAAAAAEDVGARCAETPNCCGRAAMGRARAGGSAGAGGAVVAQFGCGSGAAAPLRQPAVLLRRQDALV